MSAIMLNGPSISAYSPLPDSSRPFLADQVNNKRTNICDKCAKVFDAIINIVYYFPFDLAIYIDDFVSRYIFEPWEQYFTTASAVESSNCEKAAKWYQDLCKRKEAYCPSPCYPRRWLDDDFVKSSYFNVLKAINPSYENPQEWERVKAIYEKKLAQGTCRGQSLVTLKLAPYFTMEGPLKATIQQEHRQATTFLQLNNHLTIKLVLASFIVEKVRGVLGLGRDPRKALFSSPSKLNEAKIVYYLRKVYSSRVRARKAFEMFSFDDFTRSSSDLLMITRLLEKFEHTFLCSARTYSGLPDLPKSKWNPAAYTVATRNRRLNVNANSYEPDVEAAAEKIKAFFRDREGAFTISCVPEGNRSGHAIFLKREENGVLFYEPFIRKWLRFTDVEEGLSTVLEAFNKSVNLQSSVVYRVGELQADPT